MRIFDVTEFHGFFRRADIAAGQLPLHTSSQLKLTSLLVLQAVRERHFCPFRNYNYNT